jgi:ABC-type antimicrobial peptide transport system permease subunit
MRIRSGATEFQSGVHSVSPNYFDTLSIPLIAGRPFTSSERLGSEPVAVVSQSFATLLAGGPAAAIGRQAVILPREGSTAPPTTVRIVGVAGNVRQTLRDDDSYDIYLSALQNTGRFISLYLGTRGNPDDWTAPLTAALRELDAEISLDSPRSAASVLDLDLAQPRFLASLMTGLALFAAILAFLGVYGLVAFAVRQQEREVAIRIAVGAESGHIVRLFVRQSVIVLAIGGVVGLAGSLAIGNALRAQLHGVLPTDPTTLTITAAFVTAAAFVAMLLPTLRATRTDPATLLRDE